MSNPIGLNPAQTDASADDFITTITTLPDASWVLIPKADPNTAGKTIYEKITVANLKAAVSTVKLAETVSNLTETFTNIGVPLADTAIVSLSIKATLSSKVQHDAGIFVVGAIGTTAAWIPVKGGESGARIEIQKLSTGQIQVRRQGPLSSVRVDLVKLN